MLWKGTFATERLWWGADLKAHIKMKWQPCFVTWGVTRVRVASELSQGGLVVWSCKIKCNAMAELGKITCLFSYWRFSGNAHMCWSLYKWPQLHFFKKHSLKKKKSMWIIRGLKFKFIQERSWEQIQQCGFLFGCFFFFCIWVSICLYFVLLLFLIFMT